MFSNIWQSYQVARNHSIITKIHFWMIQRAKERFMAIFMSLVCWIDLILHIVIVLNVFHLSGKVTRSWRIIQKSQKCIFEWSKEQKKRFLAIFWTWVCWIDLILHIVAELNVFQHLATLPGHDGSFKNPQNTFLNDPKSQNRGFWPFSWVWSVGSTWYCIMW